LTEYNVNTRLLNEAGDELSILSADLDKFLERLDSVLLQLSKDVEKEQRQLLGIRESLSELSGKTNGLGIAIYTIIDVYTQAERLALGEYRQEIRKYSAKKYSTKIPNIRNASGVVMLNRTVLPDWLQEAVLKYEQSQG